MALEELGKIADGWISEGQRAIDSFEKFATTEIDKRFGGIGTQLRGFSDSFAYDERNSISGEAKPLHPNMVAGLTPIRFIGVTRVPLLGAKVVQKVATWLTSKETKALTTKSVQTTKSIKNSLSGRKAKTVKAVGVATTAYMLSRTKSLAKKIPKKSVPAIIAGAVMTHLLTNQPHGSLKGGGEEWLGRRPRDKERRWL